MLSYQHILMMQKEHSRELLNQAEQERFMRQILEDKNQNNRLHGQALSWLGGRMVAWGQSLQKRYGARAAVS